MRNRCLLVHGCWSDISGRRIQQARTVDAPLSMISGKTEGPWQDPAPRRTALRITTLIKLPGERKFLIRVVHNQPIQITVPKVVPIARTVDVVFAGLHNEAIGSAGPLRGEVLWWCIAEDWSSPLVLSFCDLSRAVDCVVIPILCEGGELWRGQWCQYYFEEME